MISSHSIIVVLPHIDGNRTSIERFKSFIFALKQHYLHVKIIHIKFPKSGDAFLGVTDNASDTQAISQLYPNDLIAIKPALNPIQSLFFKWAKTSNRKLVKPLIWLHQIIYGDDIFTPTQKIAIHKNIVNPPQQGYVIAFGGPFGVFSVANYISQQLGYKLVLDYRDPWTFGFAPIDGYTWVHHTKKIFKRNYELQLLKKATLVSTVSNSLKSYFPTHVQNKIFVLPNGNNMGTVLPNINQHPPVFTIVYAGTLYNMQLQDDTFFKALKIFINDKNSSQIKMLFIGSAGNKLLPKKLKAYGLGHISTITQRIDKHDLLNYMCNACCFLHLRYGKNTGVITSKQAEYLAYRKAILLPNSDNGDIAESILHNQAGAVCNTVDDNVLFLNSLWTKFLNRQSLALDTPKQAIDNRETIANNFIQLIMNA